MGKLTYEVKEIKGHRAIKCLVCDMESYNENDIEKKYCGNCHQFHDILMAQRFLSPKNN